MVTAATTPTISQILFETWVDDCLRRGMSLEEIGLIIKQELENRILQRRAQLLNYLDQKGAGTALIYTATNTRQPIREARYMGRGQNGGNLACIQIRYRGGKLSTVDVDPFTLTIPDDPSFPDSICPGGLLLLSTPFRRG